MGQMTAPITLEEACKLYPQASFKVATLLAAADKGALHIFKLGRRYHTTAAAMDAWVERCQERSRRPDSTWTASVVSGSFGTGSRSTEPDAAKTSSNALNGFLKATLGSGTNRRAGQTR
jgi:hypothetical protein